MGTLRSVQFWRIRPRGGEESIPINGRPGIDKPT
jgi:hypothetical protein